MAKFVNQNLWRHWCKLLVQWRWRRWK